MNKHVKQMAMVVLTVVLLIAGAMVTMIVSYASDYYTYKIYYQFEDGTTAHDPYIAVFDKDSVMDRTVKSPIIQGYQPYDSTEENAQLITEVQLQGKITDNQTMTVYYKPEMVPYRVNYLLQNINDDNYTPSLTLPDSYYQKTGLTGTFPEDLNDFSDDPHFKGFTKLFHKPDFIAADGSTEFEIYFNRNFYLIDFLLDGGYGTDAVYAKYGSNYNVAEPKKEGYVFQGWIECDSSGTPLDPNAAPQKFTNGTVLDSDRYFKAVWKAEKVNYSYVYLFETVDDSGVVDVGGKNYAVIGAKDVVKEKYSGETVSAVDNFYEGIDTQGLTINDLNSKIIPRFQAVYDDMSDAAVEQLWNKNRFTFNEDASTKDVVVKGDGSTRVYVYYDRKVYKQRFFFYRENVNEPDEKKKYEIAGYTKAFSMTDTIALGLTPEQGLQKHLQWHSNPDNTSAENSWMQIIEQRPTVWPEYANREKNPVVVKRYPETGSLHDSSNGKDYAYYYWEFETKYFENMHNTWLQHALAPVPVKKIYNSHDYTGHAAGFGAWSVEWNAYYPDGKWSTHAGSTSNRTCKGIYEILDEQLMRNDNDTTLNYLAFWTDAKNKTWNGLNWDNSPSSVNETIYIFNYLNYVEVLPEEIPYAQAHINDKLIINAVADDIHMLDGEYFKYKLKNGKYYKLKDDEVIETYDAGDQYKSVDDRTDNAKTQQTHSDLDGFGFQKDLTEVEWCGKEPDYGLNVANMIYFYNRDTFTLKFRNHNVKDEADNETYLYQASIATSKYATQKPVYPVAELAKYYTFEGWYRSPLYIDKVNFSTFKMPDRDVTFYARWVPAVEHVTFYQDYAHYQSDDLLKETDVPYNTLTLTKDIPTTVQEAGRPYLEPPVEDATFTGWYYENEDGSEKRFEPEEMPVTRDLKLYAKWTSDKTATYQIEYVVKGTNTAVADPTTGIAIVSTTNSFKAKTGDQLYESYRPQEGQNNWWPVITSHSILIQPNSVSNNDYRFEYYQKENVWYKVRYLDAYTLEPLHDDKTVQTGDPVVSENFVPIEGYIPDKMVKTLAPAASTKMDTAEAKAEELAMNTIVFLYTKNDAEAPVRIEYYVQDVDKTNAGDRASYTLYGNYKFDKQLNSVIDFDAEVYNTPLHRELTGSHFILNPDLTLVNDAAYTSGQEVKVTEAGVVIELYYQRGKYPYKVLYVDLDQEVLHNQNNTAYPDDGVIETHLYTEESQKKPLGTVFDVYYPQMLEVTVGGETVRYFAEKEPPQPLTIRHESFTDPAHPDPKVNVKKIYYTKENPRLHIHYEKRVINPTGPVDEDFAYLTPDNKEIVYPEVSIRGCTAEANPDFGDKYEFIGWYATEAPTADDQPLSTDALFIPDRPTVTTTYYAIFKMNYATYTLNYVYQGRQGGNDGSYSGDDGQTDEKVYTVTKDLTPTNLDESGMPIKKILVDNAPDIDDLYKDCVWTLDEQHVAFDEETLTVTITAVQTPRYYTVEFRCQDQTIKVQRAKLNSLVMPDGAFVEAPETNGGNPFAYWSVSVNGKETAKCYTRPFTLRVTGDMIVTACYTAEAQRLFISDPTYTREQTTDANGTVTDKLYADFILAYMEENGKLLNPNYGSASTTDVIKTGLIVEYDLGIKLAKPDAAGAVLDESEKVVYPAGDQLSLENAQKLAKGEAITGTTHKYICYNVANDKYNNMNRIDRAISFINSETARHLVLRAYYYVWNTTTKSFEMTDPVYFYLYDIGNTVSPAQ